MIKVLNGIRFKLLYPFISHSSTDYIISKEIDLSLQLKNCNNLPLFYSKNWSKNKKKLVMRKRQIFLQWTKRTGLKTYFILHEYFDLKAKPWSFRNDVAPFCPEVYTLHGRQTLTSC